MPGFRKPLIWLPLPIATSQNCMLLHIQLITNAPNTGSPHYSFRRSIWVLTTAVTFPAVGMKNLSMSKTVTSSFWLVPNLKAMISGCLFLLVILTMEERCLEEEGTTVPDFGPGRRTTSWVVETRRWHGDSSPVSPTLWHAAR